MARWPAPSAGIVGVGWALVTAVPHATLGSALVVGVVGCLPLELTITLIATLITGLALVAVLSPDQTRREAAAQVLDQLLSALTHRPPRP
jgi:hypothetical protein